MMLIISKIDYRIYGKFAKIAYIGSIIILAAVPILGSSAKGATRWLEIGPIRFQPSEIAKIALIIFFAAWLTMNKDKLKEFFTGFAKPFLYLIPVVIILVVFQDHLSATIIIILVISIMMLMAGSRLRYFITLGTAGIVAGAGALYYMAVVLEKGAFRLDRITSFLNPWNDIKGSGWQIVQSLYAIGSGGLFGAGLGESKQKYLYIPEPHNDFIFSVLAEELGFIGCTLVILLFAIFIWRGFLIAMRTPDMFGSLLAVGITSLIGLQAIMNIAVVTSSIPSTGISLPFFSYGGTALVILLCSVRRLIKYLKIGAEDIRENKVRLHFFKNATLLNKMIQKERTYMKVIIAAAGTGGHINPGIAIANKIKKEEPDSEIIFMGTQRGLEKDLVPRAGYTLKTIEAYGLSKKINIQNIKNNIKTLRGIGQAKKIIHEFKPDIVIGTGGYICGPVIIAAKKLKIPTMLHESNAFPGKAVKMLSKKVDTIMVGFKEAKEKLTEAKHVVITGTPTKIKDLQLTLIEKKEVLKQLGLKQDKPVVLVFGGSQGAKAINDVMVKIINEKKNKEYQIIWATGPIQFDIIRQHLKNMSALEGVKIVPYLYQMEEIMNASTIIIARSGAMTITEIAIVGKPAIFIPLPYVSQNHQEYNAKVLENVGAAYIILNKDLKAEDLNKKIEEILQTPNQIIQMGENARKVALRDAEERIYQEIEKLVRK